MHPTEDLIPILKKLRLSGVLETLDMRLRQSVDDDISTAEFLLRLLSDEVERRDAKQLDTRLRKANFEHRKSLDDFDFTFNPKVPKAQVIDLATCGFIRKHENVCIVGQTGVGKSHIAQAIGHRACLAGFDVLYTPAHKMLKDLRACRADGTHDRRLARYSSVDLLIIDDLGLRALTGDEPIDLYDIIRQRYERASTVITSNRGLGTLVQRPAARQRCDGPPAPPRERHRSHRRLLSEPAGTSEKEGVLMVSRQASVDQFSRAGGSIRPHGNLRLRRIRTTGSVQPS